MMTRLSNMSAKRQLKSIFLVCVLVAASMMVVFPLTAPNAKGQVMHLNSAAAEDNQSPYDMDMTPNIVQWNPSEDHWIMTDYTVEAGYTLNIPNLGFSLETGTGNKIIFQGAAQKIDVWGTLLTNPNIPTPPMLYTPFWGSGGGWNGIMFRPNSAGVIQHCFFVSADRAVQFIGSPSVGSVNMLSPGINRSIFVEMGDYGALVAYAAGFRNIEECQFTDTYDSAISVDIDSTDIDIKDCTFASHGNGTPALRVRSGSANVEGCSFTGNAQPGSVVYLGGGTNGTVLNGCTFEDGEPGVHFVEVDSSTTFIDNCSFNTTNGELSVLANEENFIPAHLTIRNPTADGFPGFWDKSFDNSTMNATGGSSITLQWYMNVYVIDPASNPIPNAPVWVEDRLGNPAQPPSKFTDVTGWAEWFTCTELIQYNNSVTYFNPFNKTAENDTMIGYAMDSMNMSKENIIIVPFNPIANFPPLVSFIQTPGGVQSGPISIQFRLEDPNIGDDGNLSIFVEFWDPGLGWIKCTAHVTSGPTSNLNNNTLYTFVWDSSVDFPDQYSTDIKIKITPFDKAGPGTFNETGNFTVDNLAPTFLTGPIAVASDNIAYINWTVDESASASVWWGPHFNGDISDLTTTTSGSSGSNLQSVQLTGLQPGRAYTYVINSTDLGGNKRSSYPTVYTFETQVHIQLYQGWNMISIPPYLLDMAPDLVLASIAGNYDAVQAYYPNDPTGDHWKHYRPGKPFGNDLLWLDSEHGIWIHMINDDVLIPSHMDPTLDIVFPGYTTVPLEAGWNFVGYPSITDRFIWDALSGLTTWDIVWSYDVTTHQWLYYDGNPGSTLTQMEMGIGYWIHCTSADIWNIIYL